MSSATSKGGRPALPAAEKRVRFPLNLRRKYHAALRELGADWLEALLERGLTREQWDQVLNLNLPAPTRRGSDKGPA